jgi:acyl dehydratase
VPAIDGAAMGVNYGFDKIRFLSPVPVGAQVRGHFTLADLQEKRPGQITNIWDISVEIQGSTRPALAAQWIGLTYLQPQDK